MVGWCVWWSRFRAGDGPFQRLLLMLVAVMVALFTVEDGFDRSLVAGAIWLVLMVRFAVLVCDVLVRLNPKSAILGPTVGAGVLATALVSSSLPEPVGFAIAYAALAGAAFAWVYLRRRESRD